MFIPHDNLAENHDEAGPVPMSNRRGRAGTLARPRFARFKRSAQRML